MNRYARALIPVLALLLIVAGSALANKAGKPSERPELVAASPLSWADAAGMDPADLGAMFDSGMGWGEIARQLNEEDSEGDLTLRPGIGWVMGANGQGHAHGQDTAPGLLKKQP